MGLFEWLFTSDYEDDTPAEVTLPGPGDLAIEVVGESHYQQTIENAAGGRTPDGHETIVNAVLVLEDTNPYDSNAVQVLIQGKPCGYLDREYAIAYRNMLIRMGHTRSTASCRAMIVGGWDRGEDDRGHFGIRLDLPYDD